MYQKLQAILPDFMVEPVTMDNLSTYETVFYSNEEYYHLTDGHPATKELCEDTICGFSSYNIHSIGLSRNGQAVSFLSILEGYPDADTLYIGLLLVDKKFQQKSIGKSIVKALLTIAADLKFDNLQLSVQENNICGLSFWKRMGFYEIGKCTCDGFDNLSMKYDLGKHRMDINVRLEEEKDYRRVEEITRAAFGYPDRIKRGQIGCPYEHWMVHELRRRDGIMALSLVAELENGTIVGHIICSNAVVKKENHVLPVLNFGPLSVLPEHQCQGVGKTLVQSMIE